MGRKKSSDSLSSTWKRMQASGRTQVGVAMTEEEKATLRQAASIEGGDVAPLTHFLLRHALAAARKIIRQNQ